MTRCLCEIQPWFVHQPPITMDGDVVWPRGVKGPNLCDEHRAPVAESLVKAYRDLTPHQKFLIIDDPSSTIVRTPEIQAEIRAWYETAKSRLDTETPAP